MLQKVSFARGNVKPHVEASSIILKWSPDMLENATTQTTRNALRAAHAARGDALNDLLNWILGKS